MRGDIIDDILCLRELFFELLPTEFVGFIHKDENVFLRDDIDKRDVLDTEPSSTVGNQDGAGDFRLMKKLSNFDSPEFFFFFGDGGIPVSGEVGEDMPAGKLKEINHPGSSGSFCGASESSATDGIDDT